MNRFLLDTNALLRFLLNDIPDQANQVEQLFQQAKDKQIQLILPQIIIFEIVFALEKYYKFQKEDIVGKMYSIVSATYLKVQNRIIFYQALKLWRDQKSISLVDCFLAIYASEHKSQVFSFDKDLNKLVLS